LSTSIMNFIRNRNFRAGPQTSLEGFICPQNSDKQQKIKVFGRSEGGGNFVNLCEEQHFILKNPQFGNILHP
ncbi:hypothetical protein, partial [Segatella sp.]|uniref:hypothetical protein n=1 Tax=Segatella sp. TaxID=2974253 RepID=UPI003AAB8E6E